MPTEYVEFRLFVMPCCGHHLCWVNPRLPSFCCECGAAVYATLKTGEYTHIGPSAARLVIEDKTAA